MALLNSDGFTPHGFCLSWQPGLIWLHVVSDGLIALAYFSIPIALIVFVLRRRDLAFSWMFVLFGVFILACGLCHIMDIWTLWHPDYVLQGFIKAATAVASVGTAIILWPLIPRALALPSPIELRRLNEQLLSEATDRIRAQDMLRQVQKMDALGQLTGGIAHDFNNMMSVVIGSLDMAKRRWDRGEANITRFIDNALEGADRAASLTRRLLAFSRQQSLAPEVTDLNSLVQGTTELLRRTLGESVEVECVVGGGLWRTYVDRVQVESTILNLGVNARDAMPEGGRLTIETMNAHLDEAYATAYDGVNAGQYVLLAVSDTGTGMSPEVAERAFDPFFTTKSPGLGTGLGLSQVYGFVKQSGGHVKIYSELGHGTTVKIYLPRHLDTPGTLRTSPSGGGEDIIPKGAQNEVILLVEDEDQVRRGNVEALRELGYTVRHARSGDEALAILEEIGEVELLFTDVRMPGMTGRQLVDKVTKDWPDIKVLFTTGYTANAIVHNGIIDPGVDLLMKPFGFGQLARKVRAVLDSGRAQPIL